MANCLTSNCNRSVYGDSDKCIFHCEKNAWFTKDNGITSWDRSKVHGFWQSIDALQGNFKEVIFPQFYKDAAIPPFFDGQNAGKQFKGQGDFTNAVFLADAAFVNLTFPNGADFSGARFDGDVSFKAVKSDYLILKEATIDGDLRIDGGQPGSLHLDGLSCASILISKTSIVDLSAKGIKPSPTKGCSAITIERLTLRNNMSIEDIDGPWELAIKELEIKYDFTMRHLNLSALVMDHLSMAQGGNSKFVMDRLAFDRFQANYFSNSRDELTIQNATFRKQLHIENSNLGKLKAVNWDLSAAKDVSFKEVSFWDTIFINTHWCGIRQIKGNRDVFRQLKIVSEKQGNHIEAAEFHSNEMDAYYREDRSLSKAFAQHGPAELGESINLFLSKHISDYANDWIRPTVLFVAIAFLFYGSALYLVEPVDWLGKFDWNELLEFTNPFVNVTDESFRVKFGAVFWLWTLHKLLSTILLYHVLVALRRKTRF